MFDAANTTPESHPHQGQGAEFARPFESLAQTGELVSSELEQPPGLTSSPTPMALWLAFKRRWFVALFLGLLLGGAGAAIMWTLTPPTIRARTKLHVAAVSPRILFPTPGESTDFPGYQRSQVALIRSRLVLSRVLKDNEIAKLSLIQAQVDPEEWLERKLLIDFAEAPEILSIALDGDRPEEMKKIVNMVREVYIQEIVNKEKTQRLRKLDGLQRLWIKYDEVQRDKIEKLKEMERALGSGNPKIIELRAQYVYNNLQSLQTELTHVESQLRQAELETFDPPSPENTKPPTDYVEEMLATHPEVEEIQQKIQDYEKKKQDYKNTLRDAEDQPAYKAVVASLGTFQKKLDAKRQEVRVLIEKRARAKVLEEAQRSADNHQKKVVGLQKLRAALVDELGRRTADIDKYGDKTINLEWLKEELAYAKDVSTTVGKQKEMLQVEIEAPDRVTELEKAIAFQAQDKKGQWRAAGLTGLGLFGLAVLAVSFIEFRSRRVNGIHDIVQGLGMKLVGAIPMLPSRRTSLIPGTSANAHYWKHLLNESIDATRTMIVHSARISSLKTIMVTSASPGEGKTLVSSHLAASLARGGFKCLLVDADLRKPSLHRIFNQPLGPGFSEMVRGEVAIQDVTRPGPMEGLSFIPAGQWDPSVVSSLSQQNLTGILEVLKCQYDFVVIDSAPVLAVADSLTIGQQVEGVVFSVLRDVSRLPAIFAAYERLTTLNIRILGAVVGGAPLDTYGSSYQYYSAPPANTPAAKA